MFGYIRNILVSIDQLANTVLGPVLNFITGLDSFGYPDETLSSVFGKNRHKCKLCHLLCLVLDRLDKRHCANSIEMDEGRNDG